MNTALCMRAEVPKKSEKGPKIKKNIEKKRRSQIYHSDILRRVPNTSNQSLVRAEADLAIWGISGIYYTAQ